jgi:hypothetical protein
MALGTLDIKNIGLLFILTTGEGRIMLGRQLLSSLKYFHHTCIFLLHSVLFYIMLSYMKRKSAKQIDIDVTKVETVSFREFSGIMVAVRNYSLKHDLTVSQVIRKALRNFLPNIDKADIH